jgi:hypothetical protein
VNDFDAEFFALFGFGDCDVFDVACKSAGVDAIVSGGPLEGRGKELEKEGRRGDRKWRRRGTI